MKIMFKILGFAFSIGVLQSCSLLRGGSSVEDISGVEWRLVSVMAADRNENLIPVAELPTLLVIDGRVSGNSGCNNYTGIAEMGRGKVSFREMAATRLFCLNGMEVETALLKVLNTVDRFTVANGVLQLMRGKTVLATFNSSNNKVWKLE